MRQIAAAVILFCVSGNTSWADQRIGAWNVKVEADSFSTKSKTIAFTLSGMDGGLGIRCFPDGLSVVLFVPSSNHYDRGQSVSFKYRADDGEILDDSASAFAENTLELPIARRVLDDAQKSKVLHFRVLTANDVQQDLHFQTTGAARALARIVKDCPADQPQKDSPSPDNEKPSATTGGGGQKSTSH